MNWRTYRSRSTGAAEAEGFMRASARRTLMSLNKADSNRLRASACSGVVGSGHSALVSASSSSSSDSHEGSGSGAARAVLSVESTFPSTAESSSEWRVLAPALAAVLSSALVVTAPVFESAAECSFALRRLIENVSCSVGGLQEPLQKHRCVRRHGLTMEVIITDKQSCGQRTEREIAEKVQNKSCTNSSRLHTRQHTLCTNACTHSW